MADNNSGTADAYWNCIRCCFRMGRMIWLLLFIVVAGYIVADHQNIVIELKRLWERIK
jgi:hypothetical protein